MKYCTMHSIRTPLGELLGREAIHLDFESYDHNASTLVFEGDFTGACCSEPQKDDFIPFLITFHSVADYRRIPLDDWYDSENRANTPSNFSFTVVEGFSPKDKRTTYIFETYDWVFKIYAQSYALKIGDELSNN